MANQRSIASVLLFVGSAMCFFLPFVTVSCGGVKAFTLTGQQLATGTTLTQPQPFGPPQTQKDDADPFAAVAALCALTGIVLSLIGRRIAGATAISGAAGVASLFIMRYRLDGQLQTQGQGLATATYKTGFTLAALLLVAGSASNVYLFLQARRTSGAVPSTPTPIQNSNDPPPIQSPTSHPTSRMAGSSAPSI
jgi:type II secretory pathway pseudopilin PulG